MKFRGQKGNLNYVTNAMLSYNLFPQYILQQKILLLSFSLIFADLKVYKIHHRLLLWKWAARMEIIRKQNRTLC